ncbi:MAG: hypothetical protein ACR2NP_04390 [Pirellulaceae bacterium]
MPHALVKGFLALWTAPNTLMGIAVGVVGLPWGTRAQWRCGCIEFHGGLVQKLLRNVPPGGSSSAMTLGHTILGQTQPALDIVREHEHVHVRQYERWGPLFIPLYLGASVILWLQGKDPYLDNPFEVEAYAIADPRQSNRPEGPADESES